MRQRERAQIRGLKARTEHPGADAAADNDDASVTDNEATAATTTDSTGIGTGDENEDTTVHVQTAPAASDVGAETEAVPMVSKTYYKYAQMCFACGMTDHRTKKCPAVRRGGGGARRPRLCHQCHQEGHNASECPHRKQRERAHPPPSTPTASPKPARAQRQPKGMLLCPALTNPTDRARLVRCHCSQHHVHRVIGPTMCGVRGRVLVREGAELHRSK